MRRPRWPPSIPVATTLAVLALAACKFPYPADVADDDATGDDAQSTDAAFDAPFDATVDAAPVPLLRFRLGRP